MLGNAGVVGAAPASPQRAAQAREGERWASALAPDTSASNRQVRDTELKQAATETLGKLEGQRRDARQDLVTEAANVRFQQEQCLTVHHNGVEGLDPAVVGGHDDSPMSSGTSGTMSRASR